MDHRRRGEIAAAAVRVLDDATRLVVESWSQLLPAAQRWDAAARAQARTVVRAVLEATVEMFAQGDLDDRAWYTAQQTVAAAGERDDAGLADLLRTVRVVGVDALVRAADDDLHLSTDERWQLHQEAWTLGEQLAGRPAEPTPGAYDELLADLYASGTDVR